MFFSYNGSVLKTWQLFQDVHNLSALNKINNELQKPALQPLCVFILYVFDKR